MIELFGMLVAIASLLVAIYLAPGVLPLFKKGTAGMVFSNSGGKNILEHSAFPSNPFQPSR